MEKLVSLDAAELDSSDPGGVAVLPDGTAAEVVLRRNVKLECAFNLLNGVFPGMIAYVSPVVAVTCLNASEWHLALIFSAFPCGAFLGPIWARLGRRWGMQGMVLRMALLGNAPLLLVPLVTVQPLAAPATAFSCLMAFCLLIYSAMKMGQSSLYRSTYPAGVVGRMVGWFHLCNYAVMVPTALIAGWLVDKENDPSAYRWLYPCTALLGLAACGFFARIRPLKAPALGQPLSLLESLRQVGRVLRQDKDYRWFQLGFFLNGSAFFMSVGVVLKLCDRMEGFGAKELALLFGALPLGVLALSSPFWGWTLDRIGIIWQRVLVAAAMTVYLSCYFLGLIFAQPWLIYVGSFLRGVSEGGGQVTWQLASVHLAPRSADVPLYNSIHFTLNGIRGLVMPWVGLWLMGRLHAWTVAVAVVISASSIFTGMNLATRGRAGSAPEPAVPEPLGAEG